MAKEKAKRRPRRRLARLEKRLGAAMKLQEKRRRQLDRAQSTVEAIGARIAGLKHPPAAGADTVVIAAAVADPASVSVERQATGDTTADGQHRPAPAASSRRPPDPAPAAPPQPKPESPS